MKYIKKFITKAAYNRAMLETPNICYVAETDELFVNDYNPIAFTESEAPEFYSIVRSADTDNDGVITKIEAAAYTTINSYPIPTGYRTTMVNILPLRWFTGLTTLQLGYIDAITEIWLPLTTSTCSVKLNQGNVVRKIFIPDGSKYEFRSISYFPQVKYINFPASILYMGAKDAWAGMTNLQYIVLNSNVVVKESANSIQTRSFPSAAVYVPDAILSNYEATYPSISSRFHPISELDEDIITNEWDDYKEDYLE